MRKRRTNNSYRQEKDWSNSQPQKTRSRTAMKKEEGAPKASQQPSSSGTIEVARSHTKLADTVQGALQIFLFFHALSILFIFCLFFLYRISFCILALTQNIRTPAHLLSWARGGSGRTQICRTLLYSVEFQALKFEHRHLNLMP